MELQPRTEKEMRSFFTSHTYRHSRPATHTTQLARSAAPRRSRSTTQLARSAAPRRSRSSPTHTATPPPPRRSYTSRSLDGYSSAAPPAWRSPPRQRYGIGVTAGYDNATAEHSRRSQRGRSHPGSITLPQTARDSRSPPRARAEPPRCSVTQSPMLRTSVERPPLGCSTTLRRDTKRPRSCQPTRLRRDMRALPTATAGSSTGRSRPQSAGATASSRTTRTGA